MPTYEYRCEKCGNNFEILQSFTDKPLRLHADCGGKVEKVFHPRGVVFKGSGFYVTDSRAKASTENGDSKKSGNGSAKPDSKASDNGIAADKSAVSSESNNSD